MRPRRAGSTFRLICASPARRPSCGPRRRARRAARTRLLSVVDVLVLVDQHVALRVLDEAREWTASAELGRDVLRCGVPSQSTRRSDPAHAQA